MEGGHEEATTTPQEPSTADGTRRPSLSERLMNPGAFGAHPPKEPQPQEPAAAVELRSIEPERSGQPVSRLTTTQRGAFADLRFRAEPVATDALKDARSRRVAEITLNRRVGSRPARREHLRRVDQIMHRQPDVLEIVATLGASRGLACRLDGGQQQCH